MAPKAAENDAATIDAPVKLRARNKSGSTSGLRERAQCATNRPIAVAEVARTATVAVDPQPQSLPLTSPSVSVPTPPVTRIVPSASGRGPGCPGTSGSFSQPATRAATPIGTLTRNTQRQLAVTSSPPTTGPSAAARPPIAVQVRTAPPRRSGG